MRKLLFSSFVGCLTVVAFAKPFSTDKAYKDLTDEEKVVRLAEARANRLAHFGEKIDKPNSQQGKIVFVDAKLDDFAEDYKKIVSSLLVLGKYNISVVKGEGESVSSKNALEMMRKLDAQIAVFVVESSEYENMILAAPDNGWAIVNATAIKKGATNSTFERARMRKAVMRAYLFAAGASYSRYPGALMSPITNAADLDKLTDTPPVDVLARCKDTLDMRGIKPLYSAFYRKAVQEGWAPAPTNDMQKAIWNKVHAVPQKPIKIEFDPKTDTK